MMYNAFISYSHSQDSKLSSSLEKALEKFAKPTFKRRALHVFRDSNDLSVSPDLWGKIETALSKTEHFIFLASPRSANSHYCNKEVEYWINTKTTDNFLIALTDGEIKWDHSKNDFDWSVTTAVPKQLSKKFKNEPLYVDFRHLTEVEDLSLENPAFKENVVLFAATLHGRSVGDMVGESVKQHKRTMRIRNAAISVLSILLLASVGLSIFAMKQKNVAERETARALLNNYISSSQAQFTEDPTKALRLAEYAYTFAKANGFSTKKATEQLLKVFYSKSGFYQEGTFPAAVLKQKNTIEHNGIRLVDRSGSATNGTEYHEIDASGKTQFIYRFQYPRYNVRFSSDGKYLLSDDMDGIGFTHYVQKRRNNTTLFEVPGDQEFQPPTSATRSNVILLAGGQLPSPLLYISDNENTINVTIEGFSGFDALITTADISKNTKYAAFGSANGNAAIIDNDAYYQDSKWNFNRFKNRALLKSSAQKSIKYIRFIDDDNYVATVSTEGRTLEMNRHVIDTVVYLWKTEPAPYYQLDLNRYPGPEEAKHDIYLEPFEKNNEKRYIHFDEKMILMSKTRGELTRFSLEKTPDKSPNGLYYANSEGIFNSENDLLVKLNIFDHDNNRAFTTFSNDGKYYKVSTNEGSDTKLFVLDPELIIERFNNVNEFGHIAYLSDDDLERFGIAKERYIRSNDALSSLESKVVSVDDLRLRETPDLDGDVIDQLGFGNRVKLLGEKSANTLEVTINGKAITDYWYKVETGNGQQGWIHGCCFVK